MKLNDGQCGWDDANDACIPEAFEKGDVLGSLGDRLCWEALGIHFH